MLLLDDPVVDLLDWEELKDWFDLAEAGSGHGRYADAKFHLNAPRALLTNRLNYEKEPSALEPFTLSGFHKCDRPYVRLRKG